MKVGPSPFNAFTNFSLEGIFKSCLGEFKLNPNTLNKILINRGGS